MQPNRKAVVSTIERSRTYSHSLASYVTRKRNAITQTDCTLFFDQEIDFDSEKGNFSEESRKTYYWALNYVNRFHHSMNQTLESNQEPTECKKTELFTFPSVPDYSSLFPVIFKKSRECLINREKKSEITNPCSTTPKDKYNSKSRIINDSSYKKLNLIEENVDTNHAVSKKILAHSSNSNSMPKNPAQKKTSRLNTVSQIYNDKDNSVNKETEANIDKQEMSQNGFFDLLKEHLMEDIWKSFMKMDEVKNEKGNKLGKSSFSIVNIQPQLSSMDYAQQKIERNSDLDTYKLEEKDTGDNRKQPPKHSSSKNMTIRPNTPVKVKNMFDRISKDTISSKKIFESKTFHVQEDSDADSVIFDDEEFEKMSKPPRFIEADEIALLDRNEVKCKYDNEKSNPLRLTGRDMTKLNEKMLSTIGLFTERGDVRPGVIDILEQHKNQKSKDTRNKLFRSKRQWDLQIHLKPNKEPPSSIPSNSSDKSFISVSSEVKLQVKNVRDQEID
ncbi:hypothetical protein JTB14_019447 [Gonioctena quinquepunctata]|nr:hypothetical protein JTB14_019447 [Gonioctena quinquepunctata]